MHKILATLQNLVRSSRAMHDVMALTQLRPLLKSFIPFTSMSMNPSVIAKICNDIVINQRKVIVELGCGSSTIVIAKVKSEKTVFYSVEHDLGWINIVKQWLSNEGMEDRVIFIHAPLSPCIIGPHQNPWYSPDSLQVIIDGPNQIDCLVVDGPPAGQSGDSALARYPAVPFFKDALAPSCSIYLDDAVRSGEKEIAARWSKDFGVEFQVRANEGGYAVARRGLGFSD